jgi:hypothetical protein
LKREDGWEKGVRPTKRGGKERKYAGEMGEGRREREEVEKGKDKNKTGGRENITQLSTPLKCTVDKSSIM